LTPSGNGPRLFIERGVAGTYNRSVYAKEKKAALDTWASHLSALIAGAGNVRRLETA